MNSDYVRRSSERLNFKFARFFDRGFNSLPGLVELCDPSCGLALRSELLQGCKIVIVSALATIDRLRTFEQMCFMLSVSSCHKNCSSSKQKSRGHFSCHNFSNVFPGWMKERGISTYLTKSHIPPQSFGQQASNQGSLPPTQGLRRCRYLHLRLAVGILER